MTVFKFFLNIFKKWRELKSAEIFEQLKFLYDHTEMKMICVMYINIKVTLKGRVMVGWRGIRSLALPKCSIKNRIKCPLLCWIEQSVYTFNLVYFIYAQRREWIAVSGRPVPLAREVCSMPSTTTGKSASLLDIIPYYDSAFTPYPSPSKYMLLQTGY